MAGHHYETVENNVTGKPVNGATVLVYEDGATKVGDAITSGTLATIYSDDGVTAIDQTANPILTDNRGFYEFWTDETVVALAFLYEGSAKRAIIDVEILGGTVSSDITALSSRVDKHDTVFGLAAYATSLGTFTGTTISDNDDVKTALQELETAVESVPTGGSAWQLQWGPLHNEAPSSNYATLDSRNGHPVLNFDTTTQEAAIFTGALPAGYAGGGVTVSVWCGATSAITGTVGWDVAIERNDASSLDIDGDSFASAQTITATTVPGTSGQFLKLSVNISDGANMDSLAAGELFRLRVRRDVANDTATGDAQLLRVMMVEQ